MPDLDKKIERESFDGFFDSLVEASGTTFTEAQLKDARDRWWRWCEGRLHFVIERSFSSLIRATRDEAGTYKFPGIADMRRHSDLALRDLNMERKRMELRKTEERHHCPLCGGLGIVNLVSFEGEVYTLDFYAFMRVGDGYATGGALMELACTCESGSRRNLPVYSPGMLSPQSPRPEDPGDFRVDSVPKGWLGKAFREAKAARSRGETRADVQAAMLRTAKGMRA